jgi:hypothetical protein
MAGRGWRYLGPCLTPAEVAAKVAEEREACAKIADTGMLVPPDGGSPTEGEVEVALSIAAAIRARGGSDE